LITYFLPWDLGAKGWGGGAIIWDSGAKAWDAGAVSLTTKTCCRSFKKYLRIIKEAKPMIFSQRQATA
jgi:hypothetical protein